MAKLTVSKMRYLDTQVAKGNMSYSKMVEEINEICQQQPAHQVNFTIPAKDTANGDYGQITDIHFDTNSHVSKLIAAAKQGKKEKDDMEAHVIAMNKRPIDLLSWISKKGYDLKYDAEADKWIYFNNSGRPYADRLTHADLYKVFCKETGLLPPGESSTN